MDKKTLMILATSHPQLSVRRSAAHALYSLGCITGAVTTSQNQMAERAAELAAAAEVNSAIEKASKPTLESMAQQAAVEKAFTPWEVSPVFGGNGTTYRVRRRNELTGESEVFPTVFGDAQSADYLRKDLNKKAAKA